MTSAIYVTLTDLLNAAANGDQIRVCSGVVQAIRLAPVSTAKTF
jgi:hypothetical protein